MNALAIVASLTDTPYLLRINDIADLTDYQIWRIYGKDRDDKGNPRQIPGSLAPSKREADIVDAKTKFLAMGSAMGISLTELQDKWAKRHGRSG